MQYELASVATTDLDRLYQTDKIYNDYASVWRREGMTVSACEGHVSVRVWGCGGVRGARLNLELVI